MNLRMRRRDVSRIIESDTWDLTFLRKGVGTASDTSISTIGLVTTRAAMESKGGVPSKGEVPDSTEAWLALIPWDAPDPKARDHLTAVQRSTGRSMVFIVMSMEPFAYKQEVLLQYVT